MFSGFPICTSEHPVEGIREEKWEMSGSQKKEQLMLYACNIEKLKVFLLLLEKKNFICHKRRNENDIWSFQSLFSDISLKNIHFLGTSCFYFYINFPAKSIRRWIKRSDIHLCSSLNHESGLCKNNTGIILLGNVVEYCTLDGKKTETKANTFTNNVSHFQILKFQFRRKNTFFQMELKTA